MISAAQCRMARAALRWTVRDLAREAEVSTGTVMRIELDGHGEPSAASLARVQHVLEEAGVEFLRGEGVRLARKPEQTP
jgi:transcriptional regulator with XRE-family HTH domain